MEEGEGQAVEPQETPYIIPENYESIAEWNLSYVTGAILDEPLNPKMAQSLSRMYTIHTVGHIDEILAESPKPLPVLKDFRDTLEKAADEAKEGDFTDIKRFLKVETERLGAGGDPAKNKYAPIGDKLRQMIELLPETS